MGGAHDFLAPIREDAPGGDDARYSAEYELLQAEIDKRNNLTGAQKIDWRIVAGHARGILHEQSKDLLVAAYLANALCYLEGLEGFVKGLELIDGCCRIFWESMHPAQKRMQGRVNAIDWWMENSGNFLRGGPALTLQGDALREAKERLAALDLFLQAKSREFPALSPLIRHLERLEESAGQNGPEPENPDVQPQAGDDLSTGPAHTPNPPGPSGSAGPKKESSPNPRATTEPPSRKSRKAAAPQPVSGGSPSAEVHEPVVHPDIVPVSSDEDLAPAQALLVAQASAICSWRLPRNPCDPVSYCLNRFAAWGGITGLPGHSGERTGLEPADPSFRELLRDLREQQEWETLLVRAELMLRAHPYWLDLCRYVDESLGALGASHTRARFLCAALTAEFVARVPGLGRLLYADGTPFADETTDRWLSGLGGSFAAHKEPSQDDKRNQAKEQGLALVRANNPHRAVRMIQECLDAARDLKEAFLWRILLGRILLEAGQDAMARVQFDLILETIERHQLEEWDKELALAGLRAAYMGIRAEDSESILDIRLGLLKRITRLSPLGALETLNIREP